MIEKSPDGRAPVSVTMSGDKGDQKSSSTGIIIEDITGKAQPPKQNVGGYVQSHKLLSELHDVSNSSIAKKGEINMSEPVDRELIHEREKTREEKIMELAATVGSTLDRPSIPYDEDLEGLD